jgi:hypothetical protein
VFEAANLAEKKAGGNSGNFLEKSDRTTNGSSNGPISTDFLVAVDTLSKRPSTIARMFEKTLSCEKVRTIGRETRKSSSRIERRFCFVSIHKSHFF